MFGVYFSHIFYQIKQVTQKIQSSKVSGILRNTVSQAQNVNFYSHVY